MYITYIIFHSLISVKDLEITVTGLYGVGVPLLVKTDSKCAAEVIPA